jgi:hypothetical protein|tara:strand:+ start:93 stop:410 length:318 start_codon:yes stop_codon:yes gene_type:complete
MIFEILADEKGKLSAARVLLTASLAFTAVLIIFDAILWATVPNAAYALLGTIFTGLLGWTAGPRIAQYFGPQLGSIASGIGASLQREPQRPTTLDNSPDFYDHER